MDYEKIYIEEVKIFNDISRKYDDLVEEDIAGAFELQKERLEEICIYLKHIHTVTKAIWLKAREDLKQCN